MLEDRDYMRQSSYGLRWSATIALLIFNAVAFLFQWYVIPPQIWANYFALSLDGLQHGFIWQLLTFQFLHGGWFHLIANSLAIYFFGRSVEQVIGSYRFLSLYFVSGIVGGLVQMLFALLLPRYFSGGVVGASAGGMGLIGAFSILNWEERFMLLLYFVPVMMRGKTLFWLTIGLSVAGIVSIIMGPGGGIAHAAHLGGCVTGYVLIRWGRDLGRNLSRWNPINARHRKRQMVKAASFKMPRWPGSKSDDSDLPSEEFISREVDPILDKISAHGIQSLTERERRILEAARSRMAKR